MRTIGRNLSILLSVATAASLLAITGPSASADAARAAGRARTATYQPPTGALLGTPEGKTGHSNKIRNALVAMIDNAPSGAYIRAVTWAYSSAELTDRLIAAHKRGVVVQVLGARKAEESRDWTRLVKALTDKSGKAADASSAQTVKGSARGADTFAGEGTTLHQKSWMFSTTGATKRVVVVTSANMTDSASDNQWTDAYIWADPDLTSDDDLYGTMLSTFEAQRKDQAVPNPYLTKTFSESFAVSFLPWNSPTMADPVVQRINALPSNASIRVATSAWYGPRGVAIARALAAKKASGAKVWVLGGDPLGGDVEKIIRGAHIPLAKGYISDTYYDHFKFMTAVYTEGGKLKTRVWTGSENWTPDARGADEIVIKVGSGQVYTDYVGFFDAAVSKFGGFK